MPEFKYRVGQTVRHRGRNSAMDGGSDEHRLYIVQREYAESLSLESPGVIQYRVRMVDAGGGIGSGFIVVFEDEIEPLGEVVPIHPPVSPEREAFEAWWGTLRSDTITPRYRYVDADNPILENRAWSVWQAAQAAK